ncbi:hypothetical protein ACIHFD_10660 [Nonomuraea sp. NPDC051941]|uniref:hypothetical protein n=1 Tax=Nonomuraea sp. NPDC051941 TaxID=3364373 RepID=UPI0037CB275B
MIKRRQDLASGGEGPPPGRYRLASPYDLDTRWVAKGSELLWNGYKVHISETGHPAADTRSTGPRTRPPDLITNVATGPGLNSRGPGPLETARISRTAFDGRSEVYFASGVNGWRRNDYHGWWTSGSNQGLKTGR